jgi:hypothetical protein
MGDDVIEWFTDLVSLWHDIGPTRPDDKHSPKGMFQWLIYNNYKLWHLEDQARRRDLPAEKIVETKRMIDNHNQQRNDAIERIDLWIDNVLKTADILPEPKVEINSETPGSIIDRLSILILKIYHMGEQIQRSDVDSTHIEISRYRLAILKEQLSDLKNALDKLVLDLRQAKKRHKIYRQFKMYNDPKFNPLLNEKKNKE